MKKLAIVALYTSAFLGVFAAAARAAVTTEAKEAVVLSVKGDVQVSAPGASPKALAVGDKLAKGSVVTTSSGAEVSFTPIDGTVSTVRENSTVGIDVIELTKNDGKLTKQKATLELRLGELVSTIDPSKKSVNDYGVRTPKGVASARGTQYTTKVTLENGNPVARVVVSSGSVVVTRADNSSVTISNGTAVVLKADGTSQTVSLTETSPPEGMTATAYAELKAEIVATLQAAVAVIQAVSTYTNADGTAVMNPAAVQAISDGATAAVNAAVTAVNNAGTETAAAPVTPDIPKVDITTVSPSG